MADKSIIVDDVCTSINPRQVKSRDSLLEAVWGMDPTTDTHVVEVYIGYLRQKLEANGESRLIQTVRGAGYMLKAAD